MLGRARWSRIAGRLAKRPAAARGFDFRCGAVAPVRGLAFARSPRCGVACAGGGRAPGLVLRFTSSLRRDEPADARGGTSRTSSRRRVQVRDPAGRVPPRPRRRGPLRDRRRRIASVPLRPRPAHDHALHARHTFAPSGGRRTGLGREPPRIRDPVPSRGDSRLRALRAPRRHSPRFTFPRSCCALHSSVTGASEGHPACEARGPPAPVFRFVQVS